MTGLVFNQHWQTNSGQTLNIVFAAIGKKSCTDSNWTVKGIELRAPNVQEDKKISRGWWGWGEGRILNKVKNWKWGLLLLCKVSLFFLRLPRESKSPTLLVAPLLNPKIIIYSRYNCRQVFQRLNPSVKIVLKLVWKQWQKDQAAKFQFWVNLTRISPLYASSRKWMLEALDIASKCQLP